MQEPSTRGNYRTACEREQQLRRQQELAATNTNASASVANGLLIGLGLTVVIGLVTAFMFIHQRTSPEPPILIQQTPVESPDRPVQSPDATGPLVRPENRDSAPVETGNFDSEGALIEVEPVPTPQ